MQEAEPTAAIPSAWRPYMREAALIRVCLHTGLVSLRKATHSETGLYSQAFLDLHAGLERLLKLIYMIDHALKNGGALPSDNDLKNTFGHNLVPLLEQAQQIRARLIAEGQSFTYDLVDAEAATRIIGLLAEFGVTTRYFNVDYLVGTKRLGRDPVAAWATDVGEYLV